MECYIEPFPITAKRKRKLRLFLAVKNGTPEQKKLERLARYMRTGNPVKFQLGAQITGDEETEYNFIISK